MVINVQAQQQQGGVGALRACEAEPFFAVQG